MNLRIVRNVHIVFKRHHVFGITTVTDVKILIIFILCKRLHPTDGSA